MPAVNRKQETSRRSTDPHVRRILTKLRQAFPEVTCELHHESAFQLLAATILSAQCTDVRVNQVTPELFQNFPDAPALARASQQQVERIIRPLGFFRAKATNLRLMAHQLCERHEGEVPDSLEQLIQLAGVGRKTANVVLGTWFGIPSGVVVDTHVKRISRLTGLASSNTPEKIEQELMTKIPQQEWINLSHRLIRLGRSVCIARRPRCNECPLLKICPQVGLKRS
ncbi:MAG: endonuclease III [Planctomycetaceae bacterium]|nr:endonuclease III [Planctomycetaceae bacterium]